MSTTMLTGWTQGKRNPRVAAPATAQASTNPKKATSATTAVKPQKPAQPAKPPGPTVSKAPVAAHTGRNARTPARSAPRKASVAPPTPSPSARVAAKHRRTAAPRTPQRLNESPIAPPSRKRGNRQVAAEELEDEDAQPPKNKRAVEAPLAPEHPLLAVIHLIQKNAEYVLIWLRI